MPRLPDPDARRVLLDAAQRLVAAGRQDFTMDDLAAEAGVSRATLYRRFGGREGLAEALAAEREVVVAAEGDDVRRRVLDAAERVFTAQGLARASIERVAAEAGVGPATIYRHFGDREGLVTAFVEDGGLPREVSRIRAAPSDDLEQDLVAVADAALAFLDRRREIIRLAFSPDPEAEALLVRVRGRTTTTRDQVAAILAHHQAAGRLPAGADPRALTLALMSLLTGHALTLPVLTRRPPWADETERAGLARRLVHLLLHGALSPAPEAP